MGDIRTTAGSPRGLEINEAWVQEAEELFGVEAAAKLVQGLEIYAEYSPEEFNDNQGVKLEAASRCGLLQEDIMQGFIEVLEKKHISKKGLLKEDPSKILCTYNLFLKKLHPEIFNRQTELLQGVFAEEIHSRILNYLIVLLAKDEKVYRRKAENDKKGRDRALKDYGRLDEVVNKVALCVTEDEYTAFIAERDQIVDRLKKSHWFKVEEARGGVAIRPVEKPVFADMFFHAIGRYDDLKKRTEEMGAEEAREYFFLSIGAVFNSAKAAWIPALKRRDFKGINGVSAERMKEENDRIFAIWREEEKRDVDMCTAPDGRLLETPLTIQLSPIDESQGRLYTKFNLQVNYHEGRKGKSVAANRAAQNKARAARKDINDHEEFISESYEGPFPPIHLNRHTGEIEALGIHPEGLKALNEDHRAYEAFRRDVLYFLAHLTCTPVTLRKMYGKEHIPTKGVSPDGRQQNGSRPGTSSGVPNSTVGPRRYPYGKLQDPAERADIIFKVLSGEEILYLVGGQELEAGTPMSPAEIREAIDNLERSITRDAAVSHRRLLPLIRNTLDDGTVKVEGAFKPSAQAQELARMHGRVLRRGLEVPEITEIFPGMDPVFHPEDLNVLFEKLGVGSVDEIVAKFPRRAFVRHETWVVPGRNEDEVSVDTDTCPEVASTKKAVKATLPKS